MTLERLTQAIRAHSLAPLPLARVDPARLPPGGLGHAAVLVPIFERDGEVHVLLTRRPERMRRHAGQMSFPGGRVEVGEDALSAALREAHEEVGLSPADVRVVGPLSETLVLQSAFRLTPWVGAVPYPYPWAAAPDEVESIHPIALGALTAPGAHRLERGEAWGVPLEVHRFSAGGREIWGATARVLAELVDLWRSV